MFVPLDATPRDYAWGSTTAMAELLGTTPSGAPEAELWLGAHSGRPTPIAAGAPVSEHADLADWFASDPRTALGDRSELPFLLKILAAAHPLSLQAHPSLARAADGFDEEERRGIPLDAANRNYKDRLHKPELIVALRDGFEALCGFRELSGTDALLADLASTAPTAEQRAQIEELRAGLTAPDGLRTTVARVLGEPAQDLVSAVVAAAASGGASSDFAAERALVARLAEEYPGDPGIVVATLVNLVTLSAGEALFLPAGNIHAYLDGIGIELMAASDNVLRGGLTPKHVDVPELLDVLDFEPRPVPHLEPTRLADGLDLFVPWDVPDFELLRADVSAADGDSDAASEFDLPGPAIAIVTDGQVTLTGNHGSTTLDRGQYAFVTPDEGRLVFTGSGTVFVATTQGR
ncbi:mannose-6-phosphate isomerase, class I [Okibacterium fritillariae]|uniref:mannose-6-phosphate isomerase n=1 Tax=Okibacterium fritillariae TaxID=123320 RepID=A0A1T5I9R6_9MICO|nr:mannose-6-phosphate isomerase, class I [Okibacterium fritillariae]SKC35936.1 mannose-6-phosphate isomerase, type 1 [Okibacterium fritillariae]